jgi:Uncharacterized alpha/beta hydrolase domain (DUF2235)
MALYAFDGTGQRDDNPELEDANDTNVARFFFAYRPNDADLPIDDRHSHYQRGVGSAGLLRKALGTITGFGGRTFVRRALDKLKDNIESGDTTIDVIGFSRGAALALDFANLIAKRGIKDANGRVITTQPVIDFIALFDVVGSFGMPIGFGPLKFQEWNIGHTLTLPTTIPISNCFHALALDERRRTFMVTRVSAAQEVWFAGVHSDVGGGNGNLGLNHIALRWMALKAQAAGLPGFTSDRVLEATRSYNPRAPVSHSPGYAVIRNDWRPIREGDRVHQSVALPRPEFNNPTVSVVAEPDSVPL